MCLKRSQVGWANLLCPQNPCKLWAKNTAHSTLKRRWVDQKRNKVYADPTPLKDQQLMTMKKLLLIFLLTGSSSACSQTFESNISKGSIKQTSTNKEAHFRNRIEEKYPKCRLLIDKNESYLHKEVIDCFETVTFSLRPFLIKKFLEKQHISTKTLTKVLEVVATDTSTAVHSKLIKQLIEAGASTKKVRLNNVTWNNRNFSCDSVMLIIKSNKEIYQQDPVPEWNRYDLHHLSDTDDGRSLCPKAIETLVGYNPKLRNIKDKYDYTPLHHYLSDSQHPDWNAGVAKNLMTKENINMIDSGGYVPLYMLLTF